MSKKTDISTESINNTLHWMRVYAEIDREEYNADVLEALAADRDRLLAINAKVGADAERFYEVLKEVHLFLNNPQLGSWKYTEIGTFYFDRYAILAKVEDAIGEVRDGEE